VDQTALSLLLAQKLVTTGRLHITASIASDIECLASFTRWQQQRCTYESSDVMVLDSRTSMHELASVAKQSWTAAAFRLSSREAPAGNTGYAAASCDAALETGGALEVAWWWRCGRARYFCWYGRDQ
jgi:hypothetical protein